MKHCGVMRAPNNEEQLGCFAGEKKYSSWQNKDVPACFKENRLHNTDPNHPQCNSHHCSLARVLPPRIPTLTPPSAIGAGFNPFTPIIKTLQVGMSSKNLTLGFRKIIDEIFLRVTVSCMIMIYWNYQMRNQSKNWSQMVENTVPPTGSK